MKTLLFYYADYISKFKGACMCSKYMACLQQPDRPDKDWLETNDCTTPDGVKSVACRELETISNYESIYGPQDGLEFEDTQFYQEYLSQFNFDDIEIAVPIDLKNSYNYDVLYKLVVASFSSDYSISDSKLDDPLHLSELCIHVQSGDTKITRKISELYAFQIHRLYEIYISEVMRLMLLAHEDINESPVVEMERKVRLHKWTQVREKVTSRSGFQKLLDEAEEKDVA